MQASPEVIRALLAIQQIDLEEMRAVKRRESLPQRNAILALRRKKAEVEKKQEQVAGMRKELDAQLIKITTEDDKLAEKQQTTQEKIDNAQGDYRSVEALSKDLSGLAKRRVTLEEETVEISTKLDQVKAVQNQIEAAFNNLASQEEIEIAGYKAEGGAINKEISNLGEQRSKLQAIIDESLLKRYEESARRGEGLAVAELKGNQCSICRNELPEGKVLAVRAEAPLSTCPICRRLLVVED